MKSNHLLLVFLLMFLSVTCWSQQDFVDVTDESGIQHFFRVDLATFGGGVAAFDYDNDGYEDLYLTGGSWVDALYKNNGDGTFTDVFFDANLENTIGVITQGVAAADVNRDGYKDLLITTMNYKNPDRDLAPNLLFLNNGDGSFTDATEEWGLNDLRSNSLSATFGDINGDGFPDLFICNYFSSGLANISIFNEQTINNSFIPATDFLLLNAGGQGFVDVSEFYGLDHDGFGFQGIFTDYDNDRDLDLYIANDFGFRRTTNLMLRNNYPNRTFLDRSINLALNHGMNAMGIAAADINFDGYMDYFVTNLGASLFVQNDGGREFIQRQDLGLSTPTIEDQVYTGLPISWGANFFDYDNDTDMDLFVCNGALNPTLRLNPNLFFEYDGNRFQQVAKEKGLFDVRVGRGSATFDYDNDGDLDLFIVNQEARDQSSLGGTLPAAKSLLYRNDAGENGNWLQVQLEGTTSEADGIGSRVEVIVDGKKLIREIDGGSSHLSQNSTIAHFGLADATTVDSIIVKWIGGDIQRLANVPANQRITIVQEGENTLPESEGNVDFSVVPNAFVDQFTIEYFLSTPGTLRIDVVDAAGRIIDEIIDQSQANAIGTIEVTPTWPAGVYYIRMFSESGVKAVAVRKVL